MRRDHFDVDVSVDDPGDLPVLAIRFDGTDVDLAERLRTAEGPLTGEDVDVTYRFRTGDRDGVLSVSNRLTGEFVLEVNLDPGTVESVVAAARQSDAADAARYRVRLDDGGLDPTVYDKETLLVYGADGSLLRRQSLIPGGVEL